MKKKSKIYYLALKHPPEARNTTFENHYQGFKSKFQNSLLEINRKEKEESKISRRQFKFKKTLEPQKRFLRKYSEAISGKTIEVGGSQKQERKIKNNSQNSLVSKKQFLKLSENRISIFKANNLSFHLTKEDLQNQYMSARKNIQKQKEESNKQKQSSPSKYNHSKIKKNIETYKKLWKKFQIHNHKNVHNHQKLCERQFKSCGFSYDENDNDRIDMHRKKIQARQTSQLMAQKQNILPRHWNNNLRQQSALLNSFDGQYVEKIDRKGLKLKGLNKLQRQYQWVKQKKCNIFKIVQQQDNKVPSFADKKQKSYRSIKKSNKGFTDITKLMSRTLWL